MPECPACGGQRNSYHDLCYGCETVLDDYFVSPEGKPHKYNTSILKKSADYDIGYTSEEKLTEDIICPKADVFQSAATSQWLVSCREARLIQADAAPFPAEGCINYTRCDLWRNAKDKGRA